MRDGSRIGCEAGAQGGEIGQALGGEFDGQTFGELGLAAAVMGQREQVDGDAAGLPFRKRGAQGLEGVPVGCAREEPVAVDEVEQRHRLAPEGVDDVVVVDDLIVPSVRMSPAPR